MMKSMKPHNCLSTTNCKRNTELDSLPLTIAINEFRKRMIRWKESTSTSPISKRHLGHHKALFEVAHPDVTEEDREDFHEKQQLMAKLCVGLINHALKSRCKHSRWSQTVNSLTFKENNDNKVHRLRAFQSSGHVESPLSK